MGSRARARLEGARRLVVAASARAGETASLWEYEEVTTALPRPRGQRQRGTKDRGRGRMRARPGEQRTAGAPGALSLGPRTASRGRQRKASTKTAGQKVKPSSLQKGQARPTKRPAPSNKKHDKKKDACVPDSSIEIFVFGECFSNSLPFYFLCYFLCCFLLDFLLGGCDLFVSLFV